MQVFEIFTYNLKQIKFKDTKDYFDSLLESLKFNYNDVMFCFNPDFSGDICKKITNKFPELSQYVLHLEESDLYFKSSPEYCFSSIKNDNGQINKYLKKEHKDCFCALLKKIPNPINFGFMNVVLDNINWYDDEIQNPIFSSNDENFKYYIRHFNTYFSNSIRFFKEFDYGNKFNLVEVMIERRISNEDLEQYPDKFNELLLKLGKPMSTRLECVFSESENKKWLNDSKKFKELIENNKIEYEFSNCSNPEIKEGYLTDSVTPVSGFSPKTIFNKIAKSKGYKYISCKNSCYKYQHINLYNHIFTVELMNIPFSSFFDATVSVSGYNFKHIIFHSPQVTVKDRNAAELFAKEFFKIVTKAENKFTEELFLVYGNTPKWYIS